MRAYAAMRQANSFPCAWCGASPDGGGQLAGRTLSAACGVATTDPWPTDAELDAAYAGPYRPAAGRFSGPGDALLRRTRARLGARIDRIAPPGPVLDVGAGVGALLADLRRRGREAVGLERAGDTEGVRSVEHLREPGRSIDLAAAKLLPGGIVIVAVPNSASLQARAFGERWLALDLPRHLVHVTAAALLARLRAAGLRVERVSHLRGGQVLFGWLHGLVGSLPGHPDLYDAIRRPEARRGALSAARRAAILAAAVLALPLAAAGTALEVALRRGGSVYVEARRG